MTTKITTTPTPLAVVDKINSIIDDKLDKTGTAASATTLSGLTATVTELNYVDGVTSNIQTQLNGKLSTSGKAASATTADSAATLSSTLPINRGGTNATTAANARTNLGLATAFTAASISGRNITLTKADGTTQTLTTQDTTSYHTGNATSIGGASATKPAVVVSTYKSGTSWYRVWSDGWVEQGYRLFVDRDSSGTITLLKAMKDTNYTVTFGHDDTGGSGYEWKMTKTTTKFSLYHYHWPAYYEIIIAGQGA